MSNEIVKGIGGFSISPELLGDSGGIIVNMGTKLDGSYLEKYKGKKGVTDRIAFLTSDPVVVKYHYIEDMGYIQCFGGECCNFDNVKTRYLFPIIVYEGKDKANCGFKVVVLSAPLELYNSIITAHETSKEDGLDGITTYDYKIDCNDENFQKLSLTATNSSFYKDRQDIITDLQEQWDTIVKNIAPAIARKITAEAFKQKLQISSGSGSKEISQAEILPVDSDTFTDD